ncbi:MAG TPA: hypothetical protein VI583_03010 [Cyclobacteriaceae bacterium]|nr:hypothetical protein [Cyclobacteriaceae bacterium]
MINEDSIYLKEIISLLNTDPQVDFSTPVFSLNPEPKYSDYQCECEDVILLSDEIICSLLITENDIESELAEFGLSIIKQTHTYTLLKVANIKTGFESLGIAAYLYESGKFKYCTPGFMSCLCLAN